MAMLTNIEVYESCASNAELCEALGYMGNEDSPMHYYNYTARSIRARAAAAIAAGKGDEYFKVGRATTKSTKSTKSPSATESLPSELLAILPAVSFKLGTSDVKQFIKDTSITGCDGESKLNDAILDILAFFGISGEEFQEQLLRWAGVPTKRDFVAEKLTAVIAVLSAASNAKFDGWTVEKMQSLLETLTAFALLSDSTKGN